MSTGAFSKLIEKWKCSHNVDFLPAVEAACYLRMVPGAECASSFQESADRITIRQQLRFEMNIFLESESESSREWR